MPCVQNREAWLAVQSDLMNPMSADHDDWISVVLTSAGIVVCRSMGSKLNGRDAVQPVRVSMRSGVRPTSSKATIGAEGYAVARTKVWNARHSDVMLVSEVMRVAIAGLVADKLYELMGGGASNCSCRRMVCRK